MEDDWEKQLEETQEKEKKEEEKKRKEEEEKKKKDTNNIPLKTDKDFMLLAQLNASKIKKAKPLPIFTLSYLKNIIELLGETLDMKQVKDIEKIVNDIFNKKLKEGIKNKGANKPAKATINLGKENDHDDDYDDYDEEDEEEEEKDVNVDNYIK